MISSFLVETRTPLTSAIVVRLIEFIVVLASVTVASALNVARGAIGSTSWRSHQTANSPVAIKRMHISWFYHLVTVQLLWIVLVL